MINIYRFSSIMLSLPARQINIQICSGTYTLFACFIPNKIVQYNNKRKHYVYCESYLDIFDVFAFRQRYSFKL